MQYPAWEQQIALGEHLGIFGQDIVDWTEVMGPCSDLLIITMIMQSTNIINRLEDMIS